MRKNTIRKIVHGILDLLPLFVIPTFMIYARNENSSFGYQVEVTESKVVDFNQLNLDVNRNSVKVPDNNVSYSAITYYINTNISNRYLIRCDMSYDGDISKLRCYCQNGVGSNFGSPIYDIEPLNTLRCTWILNATSNANFIQVGLSNIFDSTLFNSNEIFSVDNLIVCNLTQMGLDDISVSTFNSYFPNDYYPYTRSETVLIENYQTVIYNDSDVGSQMFYTLYNTVDKYFNMDNIFGMHDIYSWFELNIFGGTAPLSIYVVWNIVLYEFVMDLLMLLYALFMFFIDCCKALLEKPLNSVK